MWEGRGWDMKHLFDAEHLSDHQPFHPLFLATRSPPPLDKKRNRGNNEKTSQTKSKQVIEILLSTFRRIHFWWA